MRESRVCTGGTAITPITAITDALPAVHTPRFVSPVEPPTAVARCALMEGQQGHASPMKDGWRRP